MLKIEVKSTEIIERSGNKNGNAWHMRNQEAYAHIQNRNGTAAPYPEKISLSLDNGNSQRAPHHPMQSAFIIFLILPFMSVILLLCVLALQS